MEENINNWWAIIKEDATLTEGGILILQCRKCNYQKIRRKRKLWKKLFDVVCVYCREKKKNISLVRGLTIDDVIDEISVMITRLNILSYVYDPNNPTQVTLKTCQTLLGKIVTGINEEKR